MSSTLHTEKSTTLSTLDFFENGPVVEVEKEDGEEEDGEVDEEEEDEEERFEGEEVEGVVGDEDVEGDEEDVLLGTEGGSEG